LKSRAKIKEFEINHQTFSRRDGQKIPGATGLDGRKMAGLPLSPHCGVPLRCFTMTHLQIDSP
jgi:hypothetical protein